MEIIRKSEKDKGMGWDKDRDRGKLTEFFDCRHGVFCVRDSICPRV